MFVLSAFLFLVYFVFRNLGELRAYEWTIRPGLLAASLLLNVAGLTWGVRVWQLLLRRLGERVRFLDLARVWFVSALGRYIPGKIWQFVGAAHLGAAAGLRAATTVTSLAVHTGIFTVGAVFTAVYLLPGAFSQTAGAAQLLRWLAPLTVLLMHPAVIRGALAVVRKTTGREVAAWEGRWVDGIWLVALSMLSWALTGSALYLFILSPNPTLSFAISSRFTFDNSPRRLVS